ncbi:hypothetical protein F4810DRAFT_716267 [Camillea tinctor]|nr:hypothetical protein F4810DRAFT_716267 [Camillea tinctor]
MYAIIFPLEKTSILLLYLRLFRVHRWFRFVAYVLMAYIWMWGVSLILVAIFQCNPLAYQWHKTIDGTCIDQLNFFRWITIPNVVHNVVMLITPTPVIWKLEITTNAFTDSMWTSIQLMSWTVAESGVIFITACTPALWPMIVHAIANIDKFRNQSSKAVRSCQGPKSKPQPSDGVWMGRP